MRRPRALRRRASRRRDERGASIVEFALILPLFSLLLFGLIDFGMVFGGYITLENQVNAAARAVAIGDMPLSCQSPTDANPELCSAVAHIGTSPLGMVPGSIEVAIKYPSGGETQGQPVVVCAEGALKSSSGITSPFLNGRHVYVSSQVMLEQDVSTPPDAVDGSPAGFTCH